MPCPCRRIDNDPCEDNTNNILINSTASSFRLELDSTTSPDPITGGLLVNPGDYGANNQFNLPWSTTVNIGLCKSYVDDQILPSTGLLDYDMTNVSSGIIKFNNAGKFHITFNTYLLGNSDPPQAAIFQILLNGQSIFSSPTPLAFGNQFGSDISSYLSPAFTKIWSYNGSANVEIPANSDIVLQCILSNTVDPVVLPLCNNISCFRIDADYYGLQGSTGPTGPSGNNIYNTDGTLTGNRTVDLSNNNLTFQGDNTNLLLFDDMNQISMNAQNFDYTSSNTYSIIADDNVTLESTNGIVSLTSQSNTPTEGIILNPSTNGANILFYNVPNTVTANTLYYNNVSGVVSYGSAPSGPTGATGSAGPTGPTGPGGSSTTSIFKYVVSPSSYVIPYSGGSFHTLPIGFTGMSLVLVGSPFTWDNSAGNFNTTTGIYTSSFSGYAVVTITASLSSTVSGFFGLNFRKVSGTPFNLTGDLLYVSTAQSTRIQLRETVLLASGETYRFNMQNYASTGTQILTTLYMSIDRLT
jgi:hypothetical protein